MADLPEAREVADLVSLLAFGFAARHAYYSRVSRRAEDTGHTLLWAVIWSAPLKLFFDAIGIYPWDVFFLATATADQAAARAFFFNLIFSWIIGLLLGTFTNSLTLARRNKQGNSVAKVEGWFQKVVLCRPPRLDLVQQWIQEDARGRWVLVETKDGRAFTGHVRFYDLAQDRAKDMHFTLFNPVQVDLATGKDVAAAGEEILLSMSEVRLISLL